MRSTSWGWLPTLALLGTLGSVVPGNLCAQGQVAYPPPPAPYTPPATSPGDRPLPINLPTALQLATVRPLDIALASQRVRVAVAQLEQAHVLWLPTLQAGIDYFRHDGRIQDVAGNLLDTSKSTFMLGVAPIAIFS